MRKLVLSGTKKIMQSFFLFNALSALAEAAQAQPPCPADVLFQHYCRDHNLGSHSRSALGDLFFAWLRNYWQIRELLEQTAVGPIPPDASVALFLKRAGKGALIPPSADCSVLNDAYAPSLAAEANMSAGLWELFRQSYSSDTRVRAEAQALLCAAPTDIRVNSFAGFSKRAVLQELCVDGIIASEIPHAPNGLRLAQRANLLHSRLYRKGAFEVQDAGSQMVALLCAAEGKMRVLDYCAGAGGKALALAGGLRKGGELCLSDIDLQRLAIAQKRFARLPASPEVHFLSQEDISGEFDRVLVDAPCSGLGTARRNPGCTIHLSPDRVAAYSAQQRAILVKAAKFVRPGGELLYVTCSPLRAEDEDVANDFLMKHPQFVPVDLAQRWTALWHDLPPAAAIGENGAVRLSPATTYTDAFFIAAFQRV